MIFQILGIIGMVLIVYGLTVKKDRRRYALFTYGGIGLFLYSASIGDWIFILLQAAFTIFSFIDYKKSKRRHRYR